jgi:CRISPR/Cas system-associated protein Csm6
LDFYLHQVRVDHVILPRIRHTPTYHCRRNP